MEPNEELIVSGRYIYNMALGTNMIEFFVVEPYAGQYYITFHSEEHPFQTCESVTGESLGGHVPDIQLYRISQADVEKLRNSKYNNLDLSCGGRPITSPGLWVEENYVSTHHASAYRRYSDGETHKASQPGGRKTKRRRSRRYHRVRRSRFWMR